MKRIMGWTALAAAILVAIGVGLRASVVYNANLVNDPALAKNNTYTLNLATTPNAAGIQYLSAQATYSSTTVSASTFTDGRVSTGSVTVINNAALSSNAATNQITIAPTATILASNATNYLVVLTTQSLTGKTLTYNGNPLVGGTDWAIVATTTGTAENIKTAINRFSGVHATRTNSEVDLTATTAGAAGNSKTLAVNTSSITIGGSGFGGGHNNRLGGAYLTVNGHNYYQGGPWLVTDTSSGTATSIASMINRLSGFRAHATGSVVYSTATTAGTAGNAFTLVSSAPSYMTVAAATYSGGRNNAQVCINGTCVTQGTDWTKTGTSSGTAKAISDAIMAKSALSSILSSTWTASGVVAATTTATGTATAYTMTTNVPSYLTLSAAAMQGGQTSAWTSATSPIRVTAHGLGTGYGVVFSTPTGISLTPLVSGTTYYVAKIDANTIALSTTSAAASAGNYIVLGAPATNGPHTFTLTPQGYSGSAGLRWFVSNDGSNYNPLSISSTTITPSGVTSTAWDFGRVNFKYIQLQATGPTTGGLNLVVTVQGTN